MATLVQCQHCQADVPMACPVLWGNPTGPTQINTLISVTEGVLCPSCVKLEYDRDYEYYTSAPFKKVAEILTANHVWNRRRHWILEQRLCNVCPNYVRCMTI